MALIFLEKKVSNMEYVCSNCGSPCGQDSRGGSCDVYLICECAKNPIWINDGRGGYSIYKNDAKPILAGHKMNYSLQAKSWICGRCNKSNAPHINSCGCL